MPAAVPIKVIAHICMAVVPFMLIVIPVGSTKEEISSEHPSSSMQVLVFKGRVAAEELHAAAKTPTLATFFINLKGFSLVVKKIPIGYIVHTRIRDTQMVVTIHATVGKMYSTPYTASALQIIQKIPIGAHLLISQFKKY